MPVKICIGCGAEYLPQAQVCADCGGRLEYASGPPREVDATASGRMGVYLGPYDQADRLRDALRAEDDDPEIDGGSQPGSGSGWLPHL